jgi:anti-sigma factor RsiW
MNRRGLLGSLAAVFAAPALAKIPLPAPLVPEVVVAADVTWPLVGASYLEIRAKARAELAAWLGNRIDQLALATFADIAGIPSDE